MGPKVGKMSKNYIKIEKKVKIANTVKADKPSRSVDGYAGAKNDEMRA